MSDGFLDFGLGVDDDTVGKRQKTFKVKDGTSYRVTPVWFSVRHPADDTHHQPYWADDDAVNEDGTLSEKAQLRFAGVQRIYIKGKGLGQVVYSSPAFAQFGKPRDCIGTILCVWPTNDEGDLDVQKFAQGTGYAVMPWIHGDGDKYVSVKKIHKRFNLCANKEKSHDLLITCPANGGEYQKMTFTPEGENLLYKLMHSKKPEMRAVADKILKDARAVAATLFDDMARKMTIEEVKAKLAEDGGAPPAEATHASKDVEKLLEGTL